MMSGIVPYVQNWSHCHSERGLNRYENVRIYGRIITIYVHVTWPKDVLLTVNTNIFLKGRKLYDKNVFKKNCLTIKRAISHLRLTVF